MHSGFSAQLNVKGGDERQRCAKSVGVPKAFPSGEGGSRRLTDEVGVVVGAAD